MDRRCTDKLGRSGFTLVELLVVIGIIALLISILLPSLNKAREQAKRVACASNVRQFCTALIMRAGDHKGKFPDVGNEDGSYDSINTYKSNEVQVVQGGAVEELEKYGMTRKIFFCPSNDEQNTDYNWKRPDKGGTVSGATFGGYMIFAGRKSYIGTKAEAAARGVQGFEEVTDPNVRLFPGKTGQKTFYPVIASDLTRSYNNDLAPSNHVRGNDPTGYMPRGNGGSNVGYIDGHVEWRSQNGQIGQDVKGSTTNTGRRQMYIPGSRYYF
jgi:prepilin-type N-terminal cleavage/methylation domain-containing protein/prepilin-type processing-associated H-X9-DG protein